MSEEITFRIDRRPVADVMVTLEIYEENGERICGLRFLSGTIDLPPRAMQSMIIEEVRKIEDLAREAGCREIRHAGDDRAWFLPGYEPMPDLKNGRRKRL